MHAPSPRVIQDVHLRLGQQPAKEDSQTSTTSIATTNRATNQKDVLIYSNTAPSSSSSLPYRGAIYLYGHPFLSICSQKRRGIASENLRKLTLDPLAVYSDGKLMTAMYKQFKAFTAATTATAQKVDDDNNNNNNNNNSSSSAAAAASAPYYHYPPLVSVFYEDLLHPLCVQHVLRLLDVPPLDPATLQHIRRKNFIRNSILPDCLASLSSLGREHFAMAEEMDAYSASGSACRGAFPRDVEQHL